MEDNDIRDDRARTFATALRTFEQDSDAAAFAALFDDNATTERLDARGERRGEVEQFWQEYRGQFTNISTTFTHVVEGSDEFVLEWTSSATLTDDRSIEYRGVTAIGYEGDKIVWLRTYYDTAAFTLVPAQTAS